MSTAHVRALLDHIDAELPRESWPHWTDGWPHEIEAALLDAAFSARATYGTPTTGVRAVITRWRDHRGAPLDDLTALAAHADEPEGLLAVLNNRQRVPGNYTTKAQAVATAAHSLTELAALPPRISAATTRSGTPSSPCPGSGRPPGNASPCNSASARPHLTSWCAISSSRHSRSNHPHRLQTPKTSSPPRRRGSRSRPPPSPMRSGDTSAGSDGPQVRDEVHEGCSATGSR